MIQEQVEDRLGFKLEPVTDPGLRMDFGFRMLEVQGLGSQGFKVYGIGGGCGG